MAYIHPDADRIRASIRACVLRASIRLAVFKAMERGDLPLVTMT